MIKQKNGAKIIKLEKINFVNFLKNHKIHRKTLYSNSSGVSTSIVKGFFSKY